MSKKPVLIRVGSHQESSHPRHLYPPMDLKYIQSGLGQSLKKNIPILDNWVLNISSCEKFLKEILCFSPDIAVIKAATPCIEEAIELAAALRQAGVITIGIGQQVHHMAVTEDARWIHAFDIPVLGEPEEVLPLLIDELIDRNDISGVSRRYHASFQSGTPFFVFRPDTLPDPLFSEKELKQYAFPFPLPGPRYNRWGYVLTAWGCPHQCPHCSGVIRKTCGFQTRLRSPERVVLEIEGLIKRGAEAIVFEDDSFLSSRSHFLALCDEIIKRQVNLPWIAHMRCDQLDTSLAKRAREAGAILFKVGIESGSPSVIENLGKSSSGKKWISQARETFKLLRKYKIDSVALFLIGSPGERVSDIKESVKLASALEADYVQVQIFTLYPDTMFYSRHKEEVRNISLNNSWHYKEPAWTPGLISRADLVSEQKKFYKKFYLRRAFILKHLRRCWRFYFSGISSIKNLQYPFGWLKPPL